MVLEKIGLNFGKEIIAWTRTSSKSLLATQPIKVNIEKIKLAKPLETDIISIQNKRNLVPENSELFAWTYPKPKLNFDTINPDSLCLVHLTDHFPKNGIILSPQKVFEIENAPVAYRSTIHFSLNRAVEDTNGISWKNCRYAIIAPFTDTITNMKASKVLGGRFQDFFLLDEVTLPTGSTIIKYNSNIPNGQFGISEVFNGIKLIETSNRNIQEVANTVVKKMGYSPRNNAIQNFLGTTEDELKKLTLYSDVIPGADTKMTKYDFTSYTDSLNSQGGPKTVRNSLQEKLKTLNDEIDPFGDCRNFILQDIEGTQLAEKFGHKMRIFEQAWPKFCEQHGYLFASHEDSPWCLSEKIIILVNIMGNKNYSWANYKEPFLKILLESKTSLPKNKDLGVDVDEIIKIIKESETPQVASNKMSAIGIPILSAKDTKDVNIIALIRQYIKL